MLGGERRAEGYSLQPPRVGQSDFSENAKKIPGSSQQPKMKKVFF